MSGWSEQDVVRHYEKMGIPVPEHIARELGMKAEPLATAAEAVVKGVRDRSRPSKYGNIKTEVDGAILDSRREAKRWRQLRTLRDARVDGLVAVARQVDFILPGRVHYRADFVLLYDDGRFVVEDAKGVRTQAYLLKKKQMKECLGIEIKEV